MGLEIKTLPLVNLNTNLPCLKPKRNKNPVTEDNPAIEVMTDFTDVTPVTVEAYFSVELALDRMKTMGVRLLLVTDEHDDIGGIITSYDLQSEKPIRYAQDNGINYAEINVGMIMTPIAETPAVDYDYVKQSLVKHVINTLKQLDRPHMLIVENAAKNKQEIRGMFSTSQISKILGRKIYEPLQASQSLAEIKLKIS